MTTLVVDQAGGPYTSIQSAIDAAAPTDIIVVSPGTYIENITITKSDLTILSADGRASVTIQPLDATLDTIWFNGASNVVLGDTDQGFTILGGDGVPAQERSAVTLTNVSGLVIRGNELAANGDAALTGATGPGVVDTIIEGNIFSGQTFAGANPAGGPGFGDQFSLENVPRQLVAINSGSNVQFLSNEISGTAGGISTTTGQPFGNQLVTIDASNSTISGNTFTGYTTPGAYALRVGGDNQIVEDNIIDNSVNDSQSAGIFLRPSVVNGTFSGNSFVGADGADLVRMTPGNDAIDGGGGNDIAGYAGSRADHSIVQNPDGSYTITDTNPADGDNGSDTLASIEGILFGDGITYELDVNSPDFSGTLERFSADFETDTSAFVPNGSTLGIEASGTNGVDTEDGESHLRVGTADTNGAFTRFGGYGQGDTGFVSQIKIFLDTGMEPGEGFDWSVAASNQSGNHLRDFIFHVTRDTDSGNIIIGADNNTNSAPQLNLETKNHAAVGESGWYTFEHKFYENDAGALEVAMNVYDDAGNWLFTEVRSDPADTFDTMFGGSRYGWFTNVDVDGGIAVDSVSLKTLDENPVEVRVGTTVVGTYATIEDAKEAADSGDISGATLLISTLGQDDGFFYVVDGMSIQAAINAASDGDTIVAAAGTYSEDLSINKGVSIVGANEGIDGSDDRGAETIIDGEASITTSSKVVIDGVKFLDDDAYTLSIGDNYVALQILANSAEGHEIRNSVFLRDPATHPDGFDPNAFAGSNAQPTHRAIEISNVGAGQSVTIEGNLVSSTNPYPYAGDSWRSGIYSNGGEGITTIDGNTFVGGRSAVNADDFGPTVTISDNNFQSPGSAISIGVGSDVSNVTTITGNSFDRVDTDLNFGNVTTDIGFDFAGSGNVFAPSIPEEVVYTVGGTGNDTLFGSGGADLFLGNDGNDSFKGGAGNDQFVGGNGIDTAIYDVAVSAAMVGIDGANWTVATGGSEGTDTLSGVEVVAGLDGSVLLVGNGGFASLQAAIDAATDGDTILVAPGTYTESANYNAGDNTNSGANNPVGLLVNKSLTIVGVDANGDPITDATQTAATVVSSVQSNWGTNFFVTGDNVTIQGLRFEATAPGNVVNKAIEVVADGFTLTDSVVTATGTKSISSSVYINDNDITTSTDPDTYVSSIGSYTIDGNILYNAVVITNGTGWNYPGGATGIVTDNTFTNTVNAASDGYLILPLMITGQVDGIAWQNVPVAAPTDVSGNVFDGDARALLRMRDSDTANLPGVAFVESFTETNTGSTYAYALTPDGELRYAPDAQGAPTFYVMQSIGALQTSLGDPLALAGDTIVVDSGAGTVNETIEVDELTIEAQAGSANLNLTLGMDVLDITLADHDPGQGANVDVTGNAEDNVIIGNSGDNSLSGGGGNDTLFGGAGDDLLNGGAGVDELYGGDGNDTINGGQGNDILDGGDGDDILNGEGNADTFFFSAGQDIVNGGNGSDTMVLFGAPSDYNITIGPVPKSYTFERLSDGSVTTATDIEFIRFQQAPPDAQNDAITVDTGAVRSLNVLANDTPTGQLDVIAATLQSGDGTVSIGPGGDSIAYNLSGAYASLGIGESATAVIDYLVSTSGGQVDGATATVTVNGVDDAVTAPVDTDGTANAVAENAAIGTLVGITAEAADVDTNDTITYSIVGGDGSFAIDAGTGVVTVAGALDAEAGLQQTVTVRATSTNGQGGTTTADTEFTVNIGDVDEFDVSSPTDVDGPTGGAILENATGTVGITAFAEDADATTNAVTYELSSNPGGHFAIDENTGVVTVVSAFDRESDGPTVDLTVRANSADGSSAETVFTVAIGDVNESSVTTPVDVDGVVGGGVTENAVNGTSVGITASASDPDATNNAITYSLDDDDGGRFIISSTTGEVLVAGPIDREAGESRTIVVRATSSDGSFATQSFTIAVDDVNEFDVSTPVDSDAASNNVGISAAIGTYTGVTASATDADATNNAVSYSIVGGSGEFGVESDGRVVVASALDPAGGSSRLVTVQAASADGSVAQQTFTIDVTGAGLIIEGTEGRDIINGSGEDDTIYGRGGNDDLYGHGGNDTLDGGDGNDRLDGGAGDDIMIGGDGNDTYTVDSAGDVVIETSTGGANDIVNSSVTIAALFANIEKLFLTGTADIDGAGNDLSNRIDGNSGNNVLRGEGGNDNLFGGDGADTLYGGIGNDTLTGDAGDDILNGGQGKDNLTGGAGADKFVFDLAPTGADSDKIFDFSHADGDKIVLSGAAFSAIGSSLEENELRFGTSANAASNRLIYDQPTGRLWYDADGNGSGASVLVATLQNQAVLGVDDFEIVA